MSIPQPKFLYVEPPGWFFYRKIQPLVVLHLPYRDFSLTNSYVEKWGRTL
jgi:hypothetical protein